MYYTCIISPKFHYFSNVLSVPVYYIYYTYVYPVYVQKNFICRENIRVNKIKDKSREWCEVRQCPAGSKRTGRGTYERWE